MNGDRQLKWDGCSNVRDLGGLNAFDGRKTRWGALVRSDAPSKLTTTGWAALYAYGIRTIISLRTDGITESELDVTVCPSDLVTVRVAIEDLGDTEFAQRWAASDLWCTPLYYYDALMRWPERHAAAVTAFAQAQAGGVLIHCRRGNDRTGIITMLLLALVGVSAEDIATDYELSPDSQREELMKMRDTSTREVILDTLAKLDVEAYMLAAGLSQYDLEAVRERLLEPIGG